MKKMYLFLYVCIMLINKVCYAQIFEDFSSSDFLSHPSLKGDVAKFMVKEGGLKLNARESGRAYLSLPFQLHSDTLEWKWTVSQTFASSNNNFSRIYLWTDNSDLSSVQCRAFFLQLGENGSSDALELFYQQGNAIRSICRGEEGRIANPFQIKLRVLNCNGDHWMIFVEDGETWQLDAVGEMVIPKSDSAFTGLYVQFTSSNISKFSYDDFYCGPVLQDTLSPRLLSVSRGVQPNFLQLSFSERLDTSAINISYFDMDDIPIVSYKFINNQKDIVLEFGQELLRRHNYRLTVSSISDLSGNVMLDTSVVFVDYYPMRNDVVFSEVMADPSPAVGLPDCEYIELYNRSAFPINLSQWSIGIANSLKKLPEYRLEKNCFVFVVPQNCLDFFSEYNNVIALPSLSISNESQQLSLYADNGLVVHELEFSVNWHSQNLKAEGGWSLEMIDTDNPCSGKSNWDSSVDERGGTPGRINSISRPNSDESEPELLRVVPVDSMTLDIFFSEAVDFDTTNFATIFSFDHDLFAVSAILLMPKATSIQLKLSSPLRKGIIYTLQIVGNICDCVGLPVRQWSSAQFGLPQKVFTNDVIINEILTHTFDNSDADFVELYNTSDKIIDVADLRIAYEASNGKITSTERIKEGYLLFPQSFVVFCKEREVSLLQYYCPTPSNLLSCPSMPNFPNAQGTILLMDENFSSVDRFSYNESMHYSLLTELAGVSLERIHYYAETQNANNWKSASANVGFATPGYQNSQHSDFVSDKSSLFSIAPEIFSPDGDGLDDFVELCCCFEAENPRLSIQIYDSKGYLVKVIADNMPVGPRECFIWDGITKDGILASHGIYVVRFSYWDETGKRKSVNKFVGVAFRK